MEWHFSQTPYHYCLNNPINFTDPFGLDTLRVNPDGLPESDIKPLVIRPTFWQRLKIGIKKLLRASDDAVTGTPGPYEEVEVDRGLDLRNLVFYKDRMLEKTSVLSRDNPNFYKTFKNKDPEANTSIPEGTPDKDIKPDNTDANGNPIQETTQRQGQESDSTVSTLCIRFNDEEGHTYRTRKHIKGNHERGRWLTKPFKKEKK